MLYNIIRLYVCTLIVLAIYSSADAQVPTLAFFDDSDITICPAAATDTAPPDFTSDGCKMVAVEEVDPQGRLIWVKTSVPLTATSGPNGEPLSLYISGKMSSEVYLNGTLIGSVGKPGIDIANESPGKMDAELFPAQDLFRLGDNEIIVRASSHHGFLHLYRPFHMVGIAPTGILATSGLLRIGPALITLGSFLLGGLYFCIMALMGTSRVRFMTLCAICLFASAQLVSEMLRGLILYPYPIHDLRLILITVFSSAFGLSVAFLIFHTFMKKNALRVVIGITMLSCLIMLTINGFDYKALAGMTLPLVVSLFATGYWAYKKRARAPVYFLTLFTFVAAIALFQHLFLDTVFFFLVAFFLLLLFVEQALTLAKEARERRSEEARANQLELALAEAEERTKASYINIKSAGKMERIATNQIIHCKGASGYSEIILTSGRTLLHSATLNEMEEILPATFLRVHRSHLINVMCVKSLNRNPSGTGVLKLVEGSDIPVSRRIMPKVRQALG